MNKGDKVIIKATVTSMKAYYTNGTIKKLGRFPCQLTGIVLGYSFLKTGKIIKGNYYDEPKHLEVEKSHRVIVVEPLEQNRPFPNNGKFKTNRYLEPVRCFEEDLELIE